LIRRFVRQAVSIALAVAAVSPAAAEQATGAGLTQTDIFVSGEGGYHTYRIPSIVSTPGGALLAFVEGRRSGAADSGDIDLLLRRSLDGGKSWLPTQVIADDGTDSASNPCALVEAKTGVVWLVFSRNPGGDREADIIAGRGRGGQHIWITSSRDQGATWAEPQEITASVKKPEWTWYAVGPGIGIETAKGRLVFPANHAEAGTAIYRSHAFFSDDHGATWRLGASADAGTNESQVVELSNGRLLLNMRNHPRKEANVRMTATSEDGGVTWSAATADPALVEPPAQASLIALPHRRRRLLLFANPASTKRERMMVRVSSDDGRTWPKGRVVHEGPAAYSGLTVLRDSAIGLVYERGDRSPYERVTFVRLTLDWIEAGQTAAK
jgi:sialidase-1